MTSVLLSLLPLALVGGIVYAVYSAVRSKNRPPGSSEPDLAEAAKSLAIHAGLFLAFVAIAVGLIDLLQSFVERPQLAGSNTDLARALSLLIVGLPAFGLLLRLAAARTIEATDRPSVGWTTYLIAALTTSLIGSLVTVWQITDRMTDSFDDFEATELMQLVAWAGLWLIHWFVLRRRFGIDGAVHLAIGSTIGLAWMVGGFSGVVFRILERGYDATFGTELGSNVDWAFVLVIGLVGAVVWIWHWSVHFNRPTSIEGDSRWSPLWYLTVVGVGVLPGLLAMIVAATSSISGLLVWFVGTANTDAAEFFEPSTAIVTTAFTGLVLWAYHRWLVESAATGRRNEAMRFHDYAVVGLALLGVVTGTAALLGVFIDTVTAGETLAGSSQLSNGLIVTLTALAVSAVVWWWYWSRVEAHRAASPVAESDSLLRKLYLTVAFGVGGLVLAVSLISLLFTLLQDLLDGELGTETIDDLAVPVSWGVAVSGATWYHLGVWRADRTVLAAVSPVALQPPPPQPEAATPVQPPAPAGLAVVLRASNPSDVGELFTLQRAAFVDEAAGYAHVPALTETHDQVRQRLADSETIVAVDGHRIVGAVSLRRWRDGGIDIERLMVAPDRRGEGIATQLLDAVEAKLVADGESRVQLVVGEIMNQAQRVYDARGYEAVGRDQRPGGPVLLTMRKSLAPVWAERRILTPTEVDPT